MDMSMGMRQYVASQCLTLGCRCRHAACVQLVYVLPLRVAKSTPKGVTYCSEVILLCARHASPLCYILMLLHHSDVTALLTSMDLAAVMTCSYVNCRVEGPDNPWKSTKL